jgi:penicillin-binding protein 1A
VVDDDDPNRPDEDPARSLDAEQPPASADELRAQTERLTADAVTDTGAAENPKLPGLAENEEAGAGEPTHHHIAAFKSSASAPAELETPAPLEAIEDVEPEIAVTDIPTDVPLEAPDVADFKPAAETAQPLEAEEAELALLDEGANVSEPADVPQEALDVADLESAVEAAQPLETEVTESALPDEGVKGADIAAEPVTSDSAPQEPMPPPEEIIVHMAEPAPFKPADAPPTPDESPIENAAEPEAGPPPDYFRGAGEDPDAARASLLAQAQARAAAFAREARDVTEPKWVAFVGASRAFGGEVLRRLRGIKHPRNVREAAVWGGWMAAGGVALVFGFFFFVTWGMPSTDDLWEARNGQSITFLDRNGHVILREGAQNAPPVDLATLPPYVAQAFVAIEDRRFYHHFGVDFGGMMRAGAENLRAGRVVQGGSTITQQLAKNLFLTNERSWRRKAQEIAMAIWLETRFTKDEILALYLSRVYFGAGAYGVEAAAERYFDRPARELTLLQSAMVAGLVKAPSRLNPARQDIAAARDRAETVLTEMVTLGFISDTERQAALQEELVISRRNPAGVLGYYRDWIDPLLNEVIGTQRDDFIVETTLDIAAQRAGATSVEAVLAEQGEARRVGQAALVALDDEGGVRAMVGGRDYDQSQFNRATQAHRQPGSSFKYFIYLAAMENGLTPWSVREDAPIEFGDWRPGNYEDEYHGPTELARAFALSYNMVAIRVAHEVSGQSVIDAARRLGVTSPLEPYDSLALGAQEMTLLEMTQAYGAMAADGYRIMPHGVARIRRGNSDETMWSWRQRNRERVIEEQPMRYMNYMMRRVVDAGTGTRARITGRQIGGKTGTGNDYRDAWFVGFTPGIVAGVWVGNDNFTATARVTGGSLPADIWAQFMAVALRNTPARTLEMPRPGDYDIGLPDPETPTLTAIGAPLGELGAPTAPLPDDQDRSLDFGPEG